jgi:hypothetical protein
MNFEVPESKDAVKICDLVHLLSCSSVILFALGRVLQPAVLLSIAVDILSKILTDAAKRLRRYAGCLGEYIEQQNKLRGLKPRANYTDRATAACRRR